MKTIYSALITVWQQTSYRWLSFLAFIAFLILYLFTLPSAFTGGQISLITLEYLDTSMVILSISMAILVALIISLMAWLIRQGQKSSKASATSGVLVGVFTPLLCCSPLIPILFGSMASLLPSFIGSSGPLFQGFIATHQAELFTVAIILLFLALYQNAKKIVQGVVCQS
jgi:hypothetical protein